LIDGDRRRPSELAAAVRAPLFRFADIGAFMPRSAAAQTPAARKQRAEETNRPAKLFSTAPLPAATFPGVAADVRVAVDRFEGSGKAELIKAVKLRLTVRDGTVRLDPLDVALAGGRLTAAMTYKDAPDSPRRGAGSARQGRHVAQVRAAIDAVQIGPLVAPFARDMGLDTKKVGKLALKELFAGKLGGAVELRTDGASLHELAAALDGKIDLALEDGKMSSVLIELLGMDVTEGIGSITAKKQTVGLDCLLVGLDAQDGAVEPRVLLASTADSDIVVTGGADLGDETVDIKITTYPKDFSIGSFKTPIFIKGPLAKPRIDVDRKAAGARAAVAVALGVLVTPAASLLALIEPGQKRPGQCRKFVDYLASVRAEQQEKAAATGAAGTTH
jgi:uncharacterized protein involved in outer membrane biogenesis